ncbi:unnamed protein product [Lupinus luteus]|uniref:Expansin n=1 Tax=Lupinus luteus TaxID=3873 RepID=A0AAV1WHK5_LUPLU
MDVPRAGVISVQYRRVPCIKTEGVKFELTRNPYWLLVLVYNVANAGDIKSVSIKGSNSEDASAPGAGSEQ